MLEIISQDELVAECEEMGEIIPPFIVGCPYFEIDGKSYYMIDGDWRSLAGTLVEIRQRLIEGDRGQGLIDTIDEALGIKQ